MLLLVLFVLPALVSSPLSQSASHILVVSLFIVSMTTTFKPTKIGAPCLGMLEFIAKVKNNKYVMLLNKSMYSK